MFDKFKTVKEQLKRQVVFKKKVFYNKYFKKRHELVYI